MHDDENFKYITSKKIIDLSKKENKLLKILIENKDRFVTKETLIREIFQIPVPYRTLTVLISRLKKKLKGEIEIKNRPGFGYKI